MGQQRPAPAQPQNVKNGDHNTAKQLTIDTPEKLTLQKAAVKRKNKNQQQQAEVYVEAAQYICKIMRLKDNIFIPGFHPASYPELKGPNHLIHLHLVSLKHHSSSGRNSLKLLIGFVIPFLLLLFANITSEQLENCICQEARNMIPRLQFLTSTIRCTQHTNITYKAFSDENPS